MPGNEAEAAGLLDARTCTTLPGVKPVIMARWADGRTRYREPLAQFIRT